MGKMKAKEDKRKLTAAEQKRKENFEIRKARMESEGYTATDLTIGVIYANVMAFVLGLPVIIVLGAWFFSRNKAGFVSVDMGQTFVILGIFLGLIFVHEFIHGLFWSIFAQNRWKSISFGFIAKYFTPYCTCDEALKKGQYIMGGLMPTVILGIIPSIIAVFTGFSPLFLIGALMILAGGGDMTIVLKLLCFRTRGKEALYIDHPYLCGMVAFIR